MGSWCQMLVKLHMLRQLSCLPLVPTSAGATAAHPRVPCCCTLPALQQRPTNDDLEAIFYNQAASNTPINKGIKFLRGLGGDKK